MQGASGVFSSLVSVLCYANNTAIANIITAMKLKPCRAGLPAPFEESASSSLLPLPVPVLVAVDAALLLPSAPLSIEPGCCTTTGSSLVVPDAVLLLPSPQPPSSVLELELELGCSTTTGSSLIVVLPVPVALASPLVEEDMVGMVLSTCVPPPPPLLGCSTTRPDPSAAKVTMSPAGRVRAGPFGVRVVPDIRMAEEEEGLGRREAVRVREPAARTRGVGGGGESLAVAVVVGLGFELGE